jgi:hypothetical protein
LTAIVHSGIGFQRDAAAQSRCSPHRSPDVLSVDDAETKGKNDAVLQRFEPNGNF